MSEFNITVPGGTSKRLLTGGKFCPEDIIVTAEGEAVKEPVSEKDVNFFDYDGTLLYSYTVEEAQALTELPPLPSRKGLICQEWNWELADIKALNRRVSVGATYTTDDGKTRLYIVLVSAYNLSVTLNFLQTASEGVVVDWGDGSSEETVSPIGTVSCSHVYSSVGRYVISLDVVSGTVGLGSGGDAAFLVADAVLSMVEIGSGIADLRYYSFYATATNRITIPNTVASFGSNSFLAATLSAVVIPKGCQLSSSEFQNSFVRFCSLPKSAQITAGLFRNSSITDVTIPDSAISIGSYGFAVSRILQLVIPASVTSIAAAAFYNCVKLILIRFLPATPPTVANANAFTYIPSTCVVEVPAASLTAYQNATNYSDIAAQMVGV